jgi:hypothetical protein
MTRAVMGSLLMVLALTACQDDYFVVVDEGPAAPRDLVASYYGGVVTVSWELAPAWDGESFRVYSRRITDSDYFLIAEVTSCAGGLCAYEDANVLGGETYEYYVAAYDYNNDLETATDYSVDVFVPVAVGPPAPAFVRAVALDNAIYLTWDEMSRSSSDFSFYRVYQDAGNGTDYLLGETDSEGFLDLLAANGETAGYFVRAVDTDGHEGPESTLAQGTPRPDYHGEWMYDYFGLPGSSGFRFQQDEDSNPIMNGTSSDRHFRLEVDQSGWWIVPGPGTGVYPVGFETTALKCQVAADAACTDITTAPTSGYSSSDQFLETQTSYVLRVIGDDGATHYGVLRVELLGYDQNDDALMIFDWAYQLQAGNPDLVSGAGG